mmetsp:Transcript_20118/g.47209  ORF Transcript_20118/g.47209 Transcript_20118/m.47209 type:complete len:267 (-) Transcript_20118:653-1453(-)
MLPGERALPRKPLQHDQSVASDFEPSERHPQRHRSRGARPYSRLRPDGLRDIRRSVRVVVTRRRRYSSSVHGVRSRQRRSSGFRSSDDRLPHRSGRSCDRRVHRGKRFRRKFRSDGRHLLHEPPGTLVQRLGRLEPHRDGRHLVRRFGMRIDDVHARRRFDRDGVRRRRRLFALPARSAAAATAATAGRRSPPPLSPPHRNLQVSVREGQHQEQPGREQGVHGTEDHRSGLPRLERVRSRRQRRLPPDRRQRDRVRDHRVDRPPRR